MTTPNKRGTKRLPWQHWLPSNGATNSAIYDALNSTHSLTAIYDRIYQKRKGL